ncbi:hypothetical protein ACEWY4_010129 [Coilia grayii]
MEKGKTGAKREGDSMSPLKKKPMVTMPKEDIDDAIASAVKMALQEQQNALNLLIQAAVKDAISSILIPQLNELKMQMTNAETTLGMLAQDVDSSQKNIQNNTTKIDSLQAALRASKHQVTALHLEVNDLKKKLTQMEDHGRMSNLRLVGLKEGEEGSNAIAFLATHLPKWIPSLKGRHICIERAHRVYSPKQEQNTRPRTLIFRLLDYGDRQAILKGARLQQIKHENQDLLFFPDYSQETTSKRKAFTPLYKKMASAGLQPFLRYPAQLKITYRGRSLEFGSPHEAEDFLRDLQVPSIATVHAATPELDPATEAMDDTPQKTTS